ncbi:MAG: hypothetical protein CV089_08375 [Nitrospira sp. WS110]|nr:hypothetical protein [Nitrospira sp. WS110]
MAIPVPEAESEYRTSSSGILRLLVTPSPFVLTIPSRAGHTPALMRALGITLLAMFVLSVGPGAAFPPPDGKDLHALQTQAGQGDAEAQNNLGELYAKGRGVPQDYAQARSWYEKAATQGHPLAQNNLAELYFAGLGGPQDYVRAYMWVNLAAAHMQGEEKKQAEDNREDVAQRMTAAQITEAKRLSEQCRSKKFKGC